MLVFLLGILDILAGLSIFTVGFSWGTTLVLLSIFYLLIKSIPFITSPASMVDFSVAIVFIAALMGYFSTLLNAICAIWLIQKGVVSLF